MPLRVEHSAIWLAALSPRGPISRGAATAASHPLPAGRGLDPLHPGRRRGELWISGKSTRSKSIAQISLEGLPAALFGPVVPLFHLQPRERPGPAIGRPLICGYGCKQPSEQDAAGAPTYARNCSTIGGQRRCGARARVAYPVRRRSPAWYPVSVTKNTSPFPLRSSTSSRRFNSSSAPRERASDRLSPDSTKSRPFV